MNLPHDRLHDLDLASVVFAHLNDRLTIPINLEAEPTVAAILVGMAIAFGFGAVHALSPGHGKTMVSAYLVGSRGTPRQAVLLGLVTTMTHTMSVFGLGLVALLASQYVVPEQLYPVLSCMSGVMVCVVGVNLLKQRLGADHLHGHTPDHDNVHHHVHHHLHHHEHSHDHVHRHQHHLDDSHHHSSIDQVSLRSLIALGIAGGLNPCPSALVMLLAAIALHQVVYGLLLVSGFSLGLASVLIAIGLLVVYAKDWLKQFPTTGAWLQRLPIVSAVLILCTGIGLTVFSVL